MRTQLQLFLTLLFFCTTLFGQETEINSQNLIGEWICVKVVDKNNQEVKQVYRTYPNGLKMKIAAKGPDITIHADGTYQKKFTEEFIDRGNWRIKSQTEIRYEMVIPKNSRQGKLIIETQKLLPDKKWEKDENGNFLDGSTDKIILFTKNEMRVEYEKEYVLVYQKRTN